MLSTLFSQPFTACPRVAKSEKRRELRRPRRQKTLWPNALKHLLHNNGLIPLRADRNNPKLDTGDLAEPLDIPAGIDRQLVVAANGGD